MAGSDDAGRARAGGHPGAEARKGKPKGFGATDPRIAPYVERLLRPEDDVLREIRERSTREGLPAIAVGPFDGRHLEVLARMAGARRIVEIGTLGGYSGVCLARALPPGGRLDTFEREEKHAEVAAESFRRAGVADRVRIHLGPALERLAEIEHEGPFDLVFVDADKASYPAYFAWAAVHLRVGGSIVADNVFRRAAFPLEGDDPRSAEGIRGFNEALATSGRFRVTMLPLEDGFALGVKVS
jgi:caffeoyl-CoA O-methyltransferase